ncbi:Alpha/beta hydrolase fold-3 [Penicillium occitanis (nom. inval.)]|nr:Alpha/beta hydrolase fold-3 [Penicillium occitanis (nom. inval.)]PCH00372.1 hypothetical protein PENOC_053400 [Penicillium occitanis (nom. inval.)]
MDQSEFESYAHPAEEWTSYVRQNGLPPFLRYNSSKQAIDSQTITNAARLKASRDFWLNFTLTDNIDIKTFVFSASDSQEISSRVYRPKNAHPKAVLLYFHGGGFCSGTLTSEDPTCIHLAQTCGITIVSINYRHTPQWTCPTPFQDAWDARNWVLHSHDQHHLPFNMDLYVAGTSSGACLAASIVTRERLESTPTIKGQALWCPWLCLPQSFLLHEFAAPELASSRQSDSRRSSESYYQPSIG